MSRLEGTKPGRGIKFVLNVGIAMSCTTHKSCAAYDVTSRVFCNNFFAAQTILCRNHGSLIKVAAGFGDGLFHLRRLGRDDTKIELRQFSWICRCLQRRGKIVLA